MFLGDDFHHNGAFRLSYGLEYAWLTESSKENAEFAVDIYDTYEWYLKLGALSNAQTVFLKDKHLPTWDDFRAHPNYDAFWQRQAMKPYLTRVTLPTLNVAGWWDQEDRFGPLATYKALERSDAGGKNFLVMGPWNHGGWRNPSRRMDVVDPGTSEEYLRDIEAPFFAHFLKDIEDGRYDRYVDLSLGTFPLLNPAQRKALGLADDDRGGQLKHLGVVGHATPLPVASG